MIYVRIELWPKGDRRESRVLGELHISNDERGYECERIEWRRRSGEPPTRVGGFSWFQHKHSDPFWALVARALRSFRTGET